MNAAQIERWIRSEILTLDSALQRGLVLALFFILAMGMLYAHLVLVPQELRQGQIAPYTVFSPVSFNYQDSATLEILRGEGNTVKVIDPEKLTASKERLATFRTDLLALQNQINGGANEAEVTKATTELAGKYRLDPKIIENFAGFEESKLDSVFVGARLGLEAAMAQGMTQEKIRVLKQGGTTWVLETPTDIYVYFLQPNLQNLPARQLTPEEQKRAQVEVAKGSVIVAEGQMVDRRSAEQLSIAKEHLRGQNLKRFLGLGMLLSLFLLAWLLYGSRFTPRLARVGALSQLGIQFLIFLGIGLFLIGRLPYNFFYFGVVFSVFGLTALTVMIYEPRLALYLGLGLGIILAVALNFGAGLTVYTIAGAILAPVVLAPGAKRLTQVWFAFTQAGFGLALALAVILFSVHVLQWQPLLIALAAGFGGAVAALGMLPVVETLTALLTPNKLIELANPENEILRRLKTEAHGTYAHSQMVADLAEEACKEIKSDWLLARVGCLYHDIGKLKRPGFFAENIHDLKKNPHMGLPPATSVRILRDHVADGLVMAREARLPRELHQFIAEHHGTYMIRYFYYEAVKQHEEDPEGHPEPVKADFCYGGPLPSTREGGVVMLSDITEAVIRSRPEAPLEEVLMIVDRIVSEKLAEGQLVRSGLTIGDLEGIKAAFKRLLTARRHHRVEYPTEGPAPAPVQFHYETKSPLGSSGK